MEGEEGEINPSTGQKRDSESSGHDGSEPAQKQAVCQCKFCSKPAWKDGGQRRPAPDDISTEELVQLVAKTGGGGDEHSTYWCERCRGTIRRLREADTTRRSAKQKPGAKKSRIGDQNDPAGWGPLGELPTNPAQAGTRSSGAKDTTQSQSPPEKQAPSSPCASSLTVAGHRCGLQRGS